MEQWNNTFYYKTYLYILLRTRTYAAACTPLHVRCCMYAAVGTRMRYIMYADALI